MLTLTSPRCLALLALTVLAISPCRADLSPNLLENPSFEGGVDKTGLPLGWSLYAARDEKRHLAIVRLPDTGKPALLLDDQDLKGEVGIVQTVKVKPELGYEAAVMVRSVEGGAPYGAFLQLRFQPSGQYYQAHIAASNPFRANRIFIRGFAPADTTSAQVYVYSHAETTPKVMVESVSLVSGVEPPPPPPPPAVPPVYNKLKDLHLTTDLVKDGKPAVTIIAPASGRYDALAARIQAAIEQLTGVKVPIATDESPAGAVPIAGNLIALGNRSTSKTIEKLYNLYYCILDLKYPGPDGYNVRTLHDPFGDGKNVVFVGASDDAGMTAGTDVLIAKLNAAGGKPGALSLGRLMDIRLGKGVVVPKELKDFQTWEASAMYGSSGYFGWNMISKRMAMYYMTGDEFQAREALRLAFPDQKAKDEITKMDGEMIENKDDPLAGPYHYNAHMMILYWDLIEDSPVFTDAERIKVTNAFSRQLNHRKDEGVYGLTEVPPYLGSRHGQWAAMSLYCLARYFDKSYHDPVWAQALRGSVLAFGSLHEHAWVFGENDNLYWYDTGIAPIFTYLVMTGDRVPLENGVAARLLKAQEMLASGLVPDWALNGAALDYLHKAAYLTQDGRWLLYRDRTRQDINGFRLGQSFWPDERLQPRLPADLVGKWSINYLPEQHWQQRGSGLAPDESYYFGSYRSAPDASGDFVLIDGFNGESRNPYHTFAILELRLGGSTLLKGYRNQVLTRADGMVEPKVALDAALKYNDVLGGTAAVVADVPRAAYSDWQRSLVQRTGKYALIVDDLGFRADAGDMEVQTLWEPAGGAWNPRENAIQIRTTNTAALPPGWLRFRSLDAQCTGDPAGPEGIVRLDTLDITLLRATKIGSWLEMPFTLTAPVSGELFADMLNYVDRGTVRILLDGKPVVEQYEHNTGGVVAQKVPLGRMALTGGDHRLRLEVIGKREGEDKCFIGLTGLSIRPDNAPPANAPIMYEIRPADLTEATSAAGVITDEWHGTVKAGDRRRFFALIGMSAGTPDTALACVRIADNAAALALPQPAVAVVGQFSNIKADLAVVASDHLYAKGLTRAGIGADVIEADKPVDVDWDYTTGVLTLVAAKPAELRLPAEAGALLLDGKPAGAEATDVGWATVQLPAGRHVLTGAKLTTGAATTLSNGLKGLLNQGLAKREEGKRLAKAAEKPAAPAMKTALAAKLPGSVSDLITIPSPAGDLLAAAEGKTVHILGPDGTHVRSLTADGDIRVLCWWPEQKLLLVGCKDEKLIAFDESGARKWVFTSVMDPAVFRAAKQYWFKTAPGHEGIHGLLTGKFLNGKTQCFVGSACTLEIIDEQGKLIKRLPIFWGPGHKFQLVDAADGSTNLLIAREPTDSEALAVVNSKTLTETGRGYYTVPEGHSYVGGWACMSRDHIFYEDLEGKGQKEIVSEINGTWNRVTVWDREGNAKYSATFGPGEPIPVRNIRDLDLADLNGDGKKEIITATSSGLLLVLNNHCEKLWAKTLASPATVLKATKPEGAAAPVIVVGCQNGAVLVYDAKGELIRADKVEGSPTRILELNLKGTEPVAVISTNKGDVKGFVP